VPNELGRVLQRVQQQYWQRLLLTAVNMSEDDLRAALKSPNLDVRFAAAYVVGERRLRWHQSLIPLLQDTNPWVRQAGRRSLIILSFLALNPPEMVAAPSLPGSAKPVSKLKQPVDFGPSLTAGRSKREQAVRRWTAWWAKREDKPPKAAEKQRETGPLRMAALFAAADRRRQRELLITYRDTKGVQYTEAMAYAIARLKGDVRNEVREALVRRLTRMTVGTLGPYLGDEDAEIRRAAVLALAEKRVTAHLSKMIDLLNDPEPAVATAALAALRTLSGLDFGPRLGASEAEREEAFRQWRKWAERRRR
jgi:HEAT repeat protein